MLVIVYKGKKRREVQLRAEPPKIGSALCRYQKNIPTDSMSRLQTSLLRYPITRKEPA